MWNDSEFNSTFSSPNAAGKEVKKNLIKYIVPVTAQIINQCSQVEGENSVFEYNSLRFHQVCFIGIIRNVIKRANDLTYLIDDMTSDTEINVRLQTDESDDMDTEDNMGKQAAQAQFIENQYVKVFGIIKSLQNQKNVQAFRIMPIKELNEVTHHMLDCISASIYYTTKGGCDSIGMPAMVGNNTNPLKNANLHGDTGNNGNTGGLNGTYQQVNNFVKHVKNSEGIHIRDICAQFKTIPESKIREAVEFLSNEGHIYSTIDDEHYKTTDASESC